MAVCFTYKLWGTAGGPGLEHTRLNIPQAGPKKKQTNFVLFILVLQSSAADTDYLFCSFSSRKRVRFGNLRVTGTIAALQNSHFQR